MLKHKAYIRLVLSSCSMAYGRQLLEVPVSRDNGQWYPVSPLLPSIRYQKWKFRYEYKIYTQNSLTGIQVTIKGNTTYFSFADQLPIHRSVHGAVLLLQWIATRCKSSSGRHDSVDFYSPWHHPSSSIKLGLYTARGPQKCSLICIFTFKVLYIWFDIL